MRSKAGRTAHRLQAKSEDRQSSIGYHYPPISSSTRRSVPSRHQVRGSLRIALDHLAHPPSLRHSQATTRTEIGRFTRWTRFRTTVVKFPTDGRYRSPLCPSRPASCSSYSPEKPPLPPQTMNIGTQDTARLWLPSDPKLRPARTFYSHRESSTESAGIHLGAFWGAQASRGDGTRAPSADCLEPPIPAAVEPSWAKHWLP